LYENGNFKEDATVFLGGEIPDPSKISDPNYHYNEKLKPVCMDFSKLNSCFTTQEPYCVSGNAIGSRASSLRIFHQVIPHSVPIKYPDKPDLKDPGGEGVIVWGNYQWNEQAKGDRSGDQQIHCGAINAVNSEDTLGSGKPIWVSKSSGNFNGPPDDKRYTGTDNESNENCTKLFSPPLNPSPSYISSISVDGNYMGILFNDNGKGEVFLAPGDIRLKDNHMGDDNAKFLLVIPLQPN